MNLVGELVIDRARIVGIGAALAARYTLDEHLEALAETTGHLARIVADLQDGLMKTRMMPIETVFNRFPRMVRDLAHETRERTSNWSFAAARRNWTAPCWR